MLRYVIALTQFCKAFPRISTASDKCWDEKIWVQDYHETTMNYIEAQLSFLGQRRKTFLDVGNEARPGISSYQHNGGLVTLASISATSSLGIRSTNSS